MRLPLSLLAFTCLTVPVVAADQQKPTSPPPASAESVALPEPTKDAVAVATGLNTFSWNIARQLNTKPGNLFFSPFSIYTALNMTAAGAAGKTAAEFATVLHHTIPDERALHAGASFLAHRHEQAKTYELAVANRLFGAQGEAFKAPFLALCKDVYRAPLEMVTFPEPGRTQINTWVEGRTKDRIKDFIPVNGLNRNTTLVLVNAIFFKGTWAAKFDQAKTRDGLFTVSADKIVTTPFMFRSDKILIAKMKSATMVELPYAGGELAMDVIIPDAVDGVGTVEQALNFNDFQAAIGDLRPSKIDLFLPRFTVRWGTQSIAEPLKTLGLSSAFSNSADFSRMSDRPLFISDVYHQAFIAVDEEGTEAAAATAVVMDRGGFSKPMQVKVDRPFLFIIRDVKTNAVLFMGRVMDPS